MADTDKHSEQTTPSSASEQAPEPTDHPQTPEDRREERFSKPILRGDIGVETAQVWLSAFLIFVLGFLAYVNALNVPFHMPDQEALVNNPAMHQLTGIAEGADAVPGGPAPALSLGLLWRLTGGAPLAFQLASLFLHLANAILVFLLSRKLLSGVPEAVHMLAGLLVALHPLATESVHVAVGQAGLWATFFSLACALAFIRVSSASELRFGAWAASIACFVFAWGSSPAAAVLPVFLLVLDSYRRGFPAARAAWRLHLPFWALLVTLSVMRYVAEGGLFAGPAFTQWAGQPGGTLTALAHFVYLALAPVGLSIVHDQPEPVGLFAGPALGGLAAIGGLALLAAILVRRGQLAGLALAWFLLFLVSAFAFSGVDDPMNERLAYLPLAGLGLVLPWLGQLGIRENRYLVPVGAVLAALIIGAGVGAFMRNGYWREEAVIWGDAATKAPARIEPKRELGRLRLEQGEYAMQQSRRALERGEEGPAESLAATARRHFNAAVEQLRDAVAAAPRNAEIRVLLGRALQRAEEEEEAEEELFEALRLDFENQDAVLELAALREARGLATGERAALSQAVDLYRRADDLGALDADAMTRFAQLLLAQGKYEEAETAMERAAAMEDPEAMEAQRSQIRAYAQGLRNMRSEVVTGLRQDPQDRDSYVQLAHLRMFKNQPLQASYVLAPLLQRDPDDAEVWALLGIAMANLGEAEAFTAEWEAPTVPGEPSPWHYLARQSAQAGAWNAALIYLGSPGALAAGVTEPELIVARMAIEMNQLAVANQLITAAMQRNPQSPNPWLSLTDLYIVAGERETAAQLLGQARALGADEPFAAQREQMLGAPAAEPTEPVDPEEMPEEEEPEVILR